MTIPMPSVTKLPKIPESIPQRLFPELPIFGTDSYYQCYFTYILEQKLMRWSCGNVKLYLLVK